MIKKFIVILGCIVFLATGCQTTESEMYDLNETDEAEEYSQDEFPQWTILLRRAEIIFAGSVPFTMLLTNIGYSLYGAISTGIGDGYSIENITQSSTMTTEERYQVLGISLSLSAVISAADFVLGLIEE